MEKRECFPFDMLLTRSNFFDRQDFPFRVRFNPGNRDSSPTHPIHRHEFTELVIVANGSSVHQTMYGTYPIKRGDVFLVYEGNKHGFRDLDDLCLIDFLFDPHRLPLPYLDFAMTELAAKLNKNPESCTEEDSRVFATLDEETLTRVITLATEMAAEAANPRPPYYFQALTHFMQLLVLLSRTMGNRYMSNHRLIFIPKILEYLEQNFNTRIDFLQLARRFGMSRRNFYRKFQEATGDSPHRYQIAIRLRFASELLRHTGDSIDTIASRCGFRSSSSFSAEFKRQNRITPLKYRRKFEKM